MTRLSQKSAIFYCIIACEILQMQNAITLMLFLISYQQIMLSPHCDTSIRVSIILLCVSILRENEVTQIVSMLQQLATSKLPGRADFRVTYSLMECLTCKHLGHLPSICFFSN